MSAFGIMPGDGHRSPAGDRHKLRPGKDDNDGRRDLDPEALFPGADLAAWWLMARTLREEMIGAAAACDPPWYILLDLYHAQSAQRLVQITSLSPMIGVPHSTAGRWTRALIKEGWLVRAADPSDRRRSYVALSPITLGLMHGYFEELATKGGPPALAAGATNGPR